MILSKFKVKIIITKDRSDVIVIVGLTINQ